MRLYVFIQPCQAACSMLLMHFSLYCGFVVFRVLKLVCGQILTFFEMQWVFCGLHFDIFTSSGTPLSHCALKSMSCDVCARLQEYTNTVEILQ